MIIPLYNKHTELLTNNTSQDIVLDINYPDGIVCYDRIAATDRNAHPTIMILGFTQAGLFSEVKSLVPTVNNEVVTTEARLFVPSSAKPTIRVIGGTLGDTISIAAFGYYTID